MPMIIDDTTISIIGKICASIGVSVSLIVGYLVKKGYVDIWLTKLLTPTEEIHALKMQNGKALTKLNMSDEIVKYLVELAPGPNGTIDEEKAIECLHDCIRWNNRLIKKIPMMDEIKK